MHRLAICLLAALLFSGCSYFKEKPDETKDWTVERFYAEAKAAMSKSDFEKAIEYYEGLQARYPFGPYAQQAQLEVAYAYFKFSEPESAIVAADRFIQLYPQHPHVPYAYYLKGLVNFNQTLGFVQRYVPLDMNQRDPGTAREAFADFSTLLTRFPDSRYARNARQRMLYLRNKLAMHEVHVATWYMKRGAYLGAANRANGVVEGYQRTPAVPFALRIMTDAYDKLRLPGLSQDAKQILELNFPYHPALIQDRYIPKRDPSGGRWLIDILES
jgi:outer membrane protein assembly factor BamD